RWPRHGAPEKCARSVAATPHFTVVAAAPRVCLADGFHANPRTKVSQIPDFFRRQLTVADCNCRFAVDYVTCPHVPPLVARLHKVTQTSIDSLVIISEARMFRGLTGALDLVLRSHDGVGRVRHFAAVAAFAAVFVALNQSSLRADSAIATVHLTPGWATFGEAVPRGVAFDGLQVGTLTTQTDVKNYWDEDGSIRFAIITVNVPAEGDYAIAAGPTAAGVLTPAPPKASVTLTVGGVPY